MMNRRKHTYLLLGFGLLLAGLCPAQNRTDRPAEENRTDRTSVPAEPSAPAASTVPAPLEESPAWCRAVIALEGCALEEVMHRCHLSGREARAVVFPEALRYSALQDCLEVMALKALYVQCGGRYADFSIGLFQMKPSFAEALERELMATGRRRFLGLTADTVQTSEVRRRRLQQLQQPSGQVRYLALFLLVVHSLHPEVVRMTERERVRFLATAYNYRYRASAAALRRRQHRREYHLDLMPTPRTQWYNYADVAEWALQTQVCPEGIDAVTAKQKNRTKIDVSTLVKSASSTW